MKYEIEGNDTLLKNAVFLLTNAVRFTGDITPVQMQQNLNELRGCIEMLKAAKALPNAGEKRESKAKPQEVPPAPKPEKPKKEKKAPKEPDVPKG